MLQICNDLDSNLISRQYTSKIHFSFIQMLYKMLLVRRFKKANPEQTQNRIACHSTAIVALVEKNTAATQVRLHRPSVLPSCSDSNTKAQQKRRPWVRHLHVFLAMLTTVIKADGKFLNVYWSPQKKRLNATKAHALVFAMLQNVLSKKMK